MRLLLTSFLHDAIADFVRPGSGGGTVAYVPDAARRWEGEDFVLTERRALEAQGLALVDLPLSKTDRDEVVRILDAVDAVYVAGGETFDLLNVLRTTGTDELLVDRVRAGLPYIGCSAGSIVAGPSIAPAGLLDDPSAAPELTDYTGLGLTSLVVVPHAGGTLPPYPIGVIADTVREYGEDWPLVLLRDGDALLIDDAGTHLI